MFKKPSLYIFIRRDHETVSPGYLDLNEFEPFVRRVLKIKLDVDGVEAEATLTKEDLEWLLRKVPDET